VAGVLAHLEGPGFSPAPQHSTFFNFSSTLERLPNQGGVVEYFGEANKCGSVHILKMESLASF
jgi:hypothetical protein